MSAESVFVEGEQYLSLEVVARIYDVQVVWLREVYEFGLLGRGVDAGASICVAAAQLDRVAAIVRLRHIIGHDVAAISLQLDTLRPETGR